MYVSLDSVVENPAWTGPFWDEQLSELQAALARVDDGTYGIDEVTGEPIDPARLEAIPTARTNVETEGSAP